jgi:hypothetical protein
MIGTGESMPRPPIALALLFGLSCLAAEPHPEPRVIVSVVSVHGPHLKKDVERAARLGWGKIVGCYKKSPKRKQGAVSLELVVGGGGKVINARRTKSTFPPPLTRCLTRAMESVSMPQAAKKSTVRLEVKVAPGDDDL